MRDSLLKRFGALKIGGVKVGWGISMLGLIGLPVMGIIATGARVKSALGCGAPPAPLTNSELMLALEPLKNQPVAAGAKRDAQGNFRVGVASFGSRETALAQECLNRVMSGDNVGGAEAATEALNGYPDHEEAHRCLGLALLRSGTDHDIMCTQFRWVAEHSTVPDNKEKARSLVADKCP